MKRISCTLLFAAAALTTATAQELKLPALSPSAKITQSFSTSDIEIAYSRPSMRGRKVFGDLVPYNHVWRTGANGATRIKFGEAVQIAGQEVAAGEYAIYTIPGKEQWEVIFNKGIGNWGASGYDKKDDIVRFLTKSSRTSTVTETFTIQIANISFNTCEIEIAWENTKITIPVKTNNEEVINTAIDKAINNPVIPYFQAAAYYYETGQKLEKAMQYVDKAITQNPNAFWMQYLKARIAQKQNNKEVAVSAAQRAADLAAGTAYAEEYKKNAERIIKAMK